MPTARFFSFVPVWRLHGAAWTLACVMSGLWPGAAQAEKADRGKPLNIEADSGRYDDGKQSGTFVGNVVVTKGSLVMRASKIDVRQTPEGYQFGVATAEPGKLATFRQKRDGLDEHIEGEAQRIEYDGRSDTIRFIDRAVIRRFRGTTLADETAGRLITYDNVAEVFSVAGGASAATPGNPSGRVRAVLTPRDNTTPPPSATVPPAASSSAPPLRRSSTLGEQP